VTVGATQAAGDPAFLAEAAEVSLVLEDRRLQVKAGKSRFSLQTLPAEDFPSMALAEAKSSVSVAEAVPQLLAQTQYAMASTGRSLLSERASAAPRWHGELRAVATDGHRLAYASMPLETPEASARTKSAAQELILPRKTVVELNRLLADSDEPLAIEMLPNQIRFQFGHISLVSKLIDGRFPDYERVIPASLKERRSVSRTRACCSRWSGGDSDQREVPRRSAGAWRGQPEDHGRQRRAGGGAGGNRGRVQWRSRSMSVSTFHICSTC
jgi:DNA polymerase-3 subunit beta